MESKPKALVVISGKGGTGKTSIVASFAALAAEIERQAGERGLAVAERVRYDQVVTWAQIHRKSVVEYQPNGCVKGIRNFRASVEHELSAKGNENG